MAVYEVLVGERRKGVATFRDESGKVARLDEGNMPQMEVSDEAVVTVEMQSIPEGQEFPNNPMHFIATIVGEGTAMITAVYTPASGEEVRISSDIMAAAPPPPPPPPVTGGEIVLEDIPMA